MESRMESYHRNYNGGRQSRSDSRGRGRGRSTSRGRGRSATVSKSFQQKHLAVRISSDVVDIPHGVDNYMLENFLTLKNRLNASKNKLDALYDKKITTEKDQKNIIYFQSLVDLYKPMRMKIQKEYNGKMVTNAWMKYWEIYHHYKLIPEQSDRKFLAFFNAELPGAAINAFNHFMKTARPGMEFDWRASSLAPGTIETTNTDILGDKYGLFARNRDKWLMTLPGEKGRENNGDVTNFANLEDFARLVGPDSPLGGVDLYSHDAGIDASDDYNNQETSNARIHLGCALSGFMTLRVGGAFIAKQYTLFESFTWNLIIIYAQLFDEFYLSKPLTSRPFNSEIYLIGIGFRGLPDATKDLLSERLMNFSMKPFIPIDAVKVRLSETSSDIERFARIVFTQQQKFIEENVRLYDSYKNRLPALKIGLQSITQDLINDWMKKYPVGKISDADQVLTN